MRSTDWVGYTRVMDGTRFRRAVALAALGFALAAPGAGAALPPGSAQMGRGTDRIATAQAIWQRCGLSVPRCEHAAAVRIYSALQLLDNGARKYFLSGGCKYTKAVARPFRRAAIAFQLFARQPTTANRVAAVDALADYRHALASAIRHCRI
jgi:hypothetical protein